MVETRIRVFLSICLFCACLYVLISLQEGEQELRPSLSAENSQEIPEIFRLDLWRDDEFDFNSSKENAAFNKYLKQTEWVSKFIASDYVKNLKTKKRILLTGLFLLDEEEKRFTCPVEGTSAHVACDFVEDLQSDPGYKNYDEFDTAVSRRDWSYHFYEPKIPPRINPFFHIQESPYTLHQGDFRVNNPILTSYWRGSDIYLPYYKWIPHSNFTNITSRDRDPSRGKNYADGRSRLVAMVASHCPTYNDRLGYAKDLQRHIPVDIYGNCGTLTCEGNCFQEISKKYKFYLAFENANCRDYITEKFFRNALLNDIVPVVLGAHPSDYNFAAPPNSYIHVEDFSSTRELALYLLRLDQDDDLYNSYFAWKGTGEIVWGKRDLFCRLCAFAHYAEFHERKIWPKNAHSWLQVDPCLLPGQHFWKNGTVATTLYPKYYPSNLTSLEIYTKVLEFHYLKGA